MLIPALAIAAAAQEPPQEQAPSREVVVYGEILLEQARQALVEELREEGYTRVIEKEGRVIYRHESSYRGDVVIYDDGWTYVKRQPVNAVAREMPWAEEGSPLAVAGCVVYPWLCIRAGGVSYGQRKWRARETRTVDAVAEESRVFAERTADLAVDRTVDELPARLEALWNEGRPLDEGPPLDTTEERKAALMAYWASRTDTQWGHEVQDAIEAFVRAVVQHSDTPFSESELAAFQADRPRGW
ncbi:MAG: hypothetical protein H0V89_06360 [Deltaproteobacteria bacterium]|nr:hypothetical protein [Deltaproteobacteria bacterium]